jgi:hypothetical protein
VLTARASRSSDADEAVVIDMVPIGRNDARCSATPTTMGWDKMSYSAAPHKSLGAPS